MNTKGRVSIHSNTWVFIFAFVLSRLSLKYVDSDPISIRLIDLFAYDLDFERKIYVGQVFERDFHSTFTWYLNDFGAVAFVFKFFKTNDLRDLSSTINRQIQGTEIVDLELKRPRNIS